MAKINKLILKVVLLLVLAVSTSEAQTLKQDAIYKDIRYPERVVQLANKLETLKEKQHLEYKNREQLLFILNHIDKRATKDFTLKKLTAIAIKESSLNPNAVNKRDGTVGLFQVKTSWRKNFPWYKNPRDPFQSTQAAVNILTYNKIHFKCNSNKAIKLYNGTDKRKTQAYLAKVNAIYKDI